MTTTLLNALYRVTILLLAVASSTIAVNFAHPCRAERLPEGAFVRLGEFRKFDGKNLAYSPDGKYVAAIYLGRLIRLYDAKTGAPIRFLDGHKSRADYPYVRAYAFSPDSRYLASVGDDRSCVWNVADGRLVNEILLAKGNDLPCVYALTFSHDSKRVIVSGGRDAPAIREFDVASGELLRTIGPPGKSTRRLIVLHDGRHLLALGKPDQSGKKIAWLRKIDGDKTLFEIEGRIGRCRFAPDGKTLAYTRYDQVHLEHGTRSTCQLRLLNAADGSVRETIDDTRMFAFSPDSRLLAYTAADESGERHILVRDLESREIVLRVHPRRGNHHQILFSPDGRTLLVKDYCRVREYDVRTGKMRPVPHMHGADILALDWSRDGKQLVTATHRLVAFWDVASSKIIRELKGDGIVLNTHNVRFSPSGKLLATSGNNPIDWQASVPGRTATTRIWETASGTPRLEFVTRGAQSVAFSPDETLLAVGAENEHTHIFDVQTGEEIRKLTTTPLGQSVSFLPDGRRLAVGSNKHIHLWDVTTGEIVARLDNRGSFVKSLCPVPSNLGLISMSDRRLAFWDLNRRQSSVVFTDYYRGTDTMALSNDGRLLAVTGAHRDPTAEGVATTREHQIPCIRLFEVATGAILHEFVRPGHDFGVMAFPPDRRVLAAATANTVLLFDVAQWTGADEPEPATMSAEEFAAAWKELGSSNAQEAYSAMAQLRAAGQSSTQFISEHLRPLRDAMPAPQVLAELLRQLDDDKFAVRERAVEELTRIGPAIVPDMEKLSRDSPSAEVRFRARSIVGEFRSRKGFLIESEDQLRAYRAIQVLEQLGTPKADQLLKQLAGGAPGRQTVEAKLGVDRRETVSHE